MIEARKISKAFGRERVLEDVSFCLEPRQTLSILGRSGSGKTTLLKIFAGLTGGYQGEIRLNGRAIDGVPARDRGIVYLNQEPLLFPHLDVTGNIGFGLRIRGESKARIKEKTADMIRRLQLEGQEDKYPEQLSGGQKQRVAFGRAFIIHPAMLLLDEPFGSLDPETRGEMQQLFVEIARSEGITTLFVTHDLKEALRTGDQFGMMEAGRLRVFDSREAFMQDAGSGVREELQFWNSLQAPDDDS